MKREARKNESANLVWAVAVAFALALLISFWPHLWWVGALFLAAPSIMMMARWYHQSARCLDPKCRGMAPGTHHPGCDHC